MATFDLIMLKWELSNLQIFFILIAENIQMVNIVFLGQMLQCVIITFKILVSIAKPAFLFQHKNEEFLFA